MNPQGPKRWLILGAATALLFCLGGLYAWSIFIPPLREADHLSMAQCQTIFGTMIAVFTLAMVPAGQWVARGRARESALVGAALFWLGYQLAHEALSWPCGSDWVCWPAPAPDSAMARR